MAKKSAAVTAAKSKSFDDIKFYVLLAMLGFAVYANSLANDFVFDDESVVLGDPSLVDLGNIPKYFTGAEGFHKVIGRYYRPVVSASYNIDYNLWGPKPFGFHLTNILIHIINILLVYKLLLLLFLNVQHKYKNYFLILGAAFFAIHPIHTEAVAWVSGRTDSLFFTFFAASMIYYLKFKEDNSEKSLLLISVYYFISLLAKEMAITLPVIIVAYEFIVNRKRRIADFADVKRPLIYLAAVSVLYLFIRWLILKDVPIRETYNYFYLKDGLTIFYTMLQSVPIYFRLVLVPYGMIYHYSGYLPYQSSVASFAVLFAIGFIITLGFCTYYLLKRMPWLAFSVVFVAVTLMPVLNIIQTMNFMADRFLYLPSLAFSFAAVALLIKFYSPKREVIVFSVVAAFSIFFLYLTVARNAEWKNNDTLFMSADGKPGTIVAVNIGNIYANKQQYDKAEPYYRQAIALRDQTILANNNLGKIFMIKGNFDSAYYYMYKAYSLDTLSPEPMYSLGLLLSNFNKPGDAAFWLKKILTINPNGYMNSNKMLEQLSATNPNLNNLPQNIQPQNNQPQNNITEQMPMQQGEVGRLERESYELYQKKEYDKAIEDLNKLIELAPGTSYSYNNNIGMCYLDQGKNEDAKKYFELSVKGKKDFTPAHSNLGVAYQRLGNKPKAREQFKKALELDPNNEEAKTKLKELDQ